jgi:hypothetical protein
MNRTAPGTVTLSREELYRQVWTTPVSRLAKRHGLSHAGSENSDHLLSGDSGHPGGL